MQFLEVFFVAFIHCAVYVLNSYFIEAKDLS